MRKKSSKSKEFKKIDNDEIKLIDVFNDSD